MGQRTSKGNEIADEPALIRLTARHMEAQLTLRHEVFIRVSSDRGARPRVGKRRAQAQPKP